MSKYYTTTLQKGSKGDEVKRWQEFLNSQGYNLGVDGDFGDKTYAATTDWQSKNGLGADGIVGKNTWGKAGYTYVDLNPVSAPVIDTTSWDATEKGSTALGAFTDAKDAVTNYGPFSFSLDEWAKSVDDKIQNFKDFSYDLDGDALYQQAKDNYTQLGKLAMADTMGQAAAMTGGYGNSYAQSVGQQAYQNQLDNLNDIVPDLYNMALDRYKMDKDDLYTQASYLQQKYAQEKGEYSDEYQRLLDALEMESDDYYSGADMYYTEQDTNNTEAWNQVNWAETLRQAILADYWNSKEYDAVYGNNSTNSTNNNNSNNNNKQPAKETAKDPETVTPTQTGATTSFINSHMTSTEFMQRGGTSKTPSLQGGGGRSYAEYKAYIKEKLEAEWDMFTDSEKAYLIEYYKL